ncbi:acyl-CoA thioesterase [Novosphingobium sp. Leaf2]|uniref:acyl-CoA thioesterase n=1 Tax=Novosphingobium sp. Leaf2 TaxID=1735670 RepID=UPI0006F635D4|nr:acyl-CoA thioesterase domain-containing protein [Novosphingobium sp. Leaf2]KQM21048.1 acyl-CoA thioesterase II [Novosphingobium sp. Leaf2]
MIDENPFVDDPETERRLGYAFDEIAPDHFRVQPVPSSLLRLYGGMALSQCLAAARLTVPQDKTAHSLHAYFLKPGLIDRPLEMQVTRESDGRSFANRMVRMTQDGVPIINMMASFKAPEQAGRHGMPMPDVPAPEELTSLDELVANYGDRLPERHRPFWRRRQQVDWRPVGFFSFDERTPRPATRALWFRFNGIVDGPLDVHQRLLVYASDLHIFHTALGPLGIGWANDFLQSSSLDHAVWFHDEFRADEWMLYALDSPASTDALALGRGNIYRRDGTLVATVSQQGLARVLNEKREGRL